MILTEDIRDYQRLSDNSPVGIIALDYDGFPLYVNKTLVNITGYSLKDFNRDGFFAVIHPDYRKIVAGNFAARIHGESVPYEYDIKAISKSGEVLWVSAYIYLDEIFGKKAVVVHAVDISRRKEAEIELARSEEKWRKLFENSLDGILRTDGKGNIKECNASFARMLGYDTAEDFMEKYDNINEATVPDDFESEVELIRGLKAGGKPVRFEKAYFTKYGAIVPATVSVSASILADDSETELWGIVRDESERKAAEKKLLERRSFLEKVIETMPNPVFFIDDTGEIKLCNSSFSKTFFAKKTDEIINKKISDFSEVFKESAIRRLKIKDAALLRAGGSEVFELELIDAGGENHIFQFNRSALQFSDEYFHGIINVLSDVTEIREYARELEYAKSIQNDYAKKLTRLVGEAEEARINAESAGDAKSEFVADITREIRSPLNAIVVYAELLHEEVKSGESNEYLNKIVAAARKISELADDLSDLSKIEAGETIVRNNPVDFRKIAKEIKSIYRPKIKNKKLSIVCEIDSSIRSEFVLDDVRLRRALFGLVGSAIRSSTEGKISIRFRADYLDGDEANLCINISLPEVVSERLNGDYSIDGFSGVREAVESVGGKIEFETFATGGRNATIYFERRPVA